MTDDPFRGTGRTTRQIKSAPPNAIYVVAGNDRYVKDLAANLGRTDITVMGAEHAADRGLAGTNCYAVIDHFVFEPTSPFASPIRRDKLWAAVQLACLRHKEKSSVPT